MIIWKYYSGALNTHAYDKGISCDVRDDLHMYIMIQATKKLMC